MNINLKNYQEKAVGELIASFKSLLSKDEQKKVCVFQAPTGSGKTLMTAKFIEELIRELPETDLCFVWVSIGKGDLHLQSKHSLERIFGGAPRVSLVEEEFTGGRERIVRNEIVVVNWEKLRSKDRATGDWKNVLMKDGEKLNFRDVLAKTREQRKVILIIDESHIGATAERTNELRDEINADVILEMSATPKIKPDPRDLARGTAAYVFVEPKDVIDEGMIKKELIINEKIDEIIDDEMDSQKVVLETAYKKRLELKKFFEAEKSNINPLVLVQIPVAEAGEDKIRAVKKFLADKDITERKNGQGNGKLAIWLSEQKSETLDWIAEPDNEIEFLIFKQAIDTGWDCPRAHILVKFRESHSETFEIQTVGRILRMPEQKHYASEDLNRGYIYTNVQSIIVKKEEYNPNIIKHLKATRKDVYRPIKLTSYYKSRADYGDITSSFTPVFEKTACEEFGLKGDHTFFAQNVKKVEDKGVVLDIKKYQQEIIANARIKGKTFDEIEGKINSADRARLIIAGNDLQALFEQIIKNNLGSFKNIKRSVPTVKTAIYSWFKKYLGSKEWSEEIILVQMIFVHNGNRKKFEKILASAIEKYKAVREKEILKRVEESEQFYDFEIKKESSFNQYIDELMSYKKYVYDPCYLSVNRSIPEKNFEKFLVENDDKIVWWWKNGENKQDYFGIKYEYPVGVIHTFYPDYLAQFTDGRIGIFETKDTGDRDGGTYTKAKAEKLQEYIKNQKSQKLFGGIVIEKSDGWKINQKPLYNWSKCERNDWSDWDKLKI
ncbi:MAG TPA: DEAD/DEAH box helicase family protein [bacterium]|nr:DEAD/DEAH box helicase family protein [bacterium]HOQ91732.1 DEAD/DEAH box helicase family protein [bacterium]